MKKLILLLLCMSSSFIGADELLTAIDRKDFKSVIRIIDQKQYNPALYFEYLTAAQDSLTACRDEHFLQKIKPQPQVIFAAMGLVCATWFGYHPMKDIIYLNNKSFLNIIEMNILNNSWNQLYFSIFVAEIFFTIGQIISYQEVSSEFKRAEAIYKLLIRYRDLFHILNMKQTSKLPT